MNNRISKSLTATGLLALFLVLHACDTKSVPAEDNSWSSDNLRGKVKRVLEASYQAVNQDGEWAKGRQNQTYNVKTYSEEGFLLTERTYYSDTNENYGGFNYIYDENQNLLRINVIDPSGAVVSYSDIEKRDGKVGIRVYTEYYGEGDDAVITSKTEMNWENFKVVSASTFDGNLQPMSTNTYEYDDNGDLTVFSIKNVSGNQRDVVVHYKYLYFDNTGNWTRQFKEYQGYPVKEIAERTYEYYQ